MAVLQKGQKCLGALFTLGTEHLWLSGQSLQLRACIHTCPEPTWWPLVLRRSWCHPAFSCLSVNLPWHTWCSFLSQRPSPATLPLLSEFDCRELNCRELNWLAPAWHCMPACCAVKIPLWLAVTSPSIYFRRFEVKKIPTVHGQEHQVKPKERWTKHSGDAAKASERMPVLWSVTDPVTDRGDKPAMPCRAVPSAACRLHCQHTHRPSDALLSRGDTTTSSRETSLSEHPAASLASHWHWVWQLPPHSHRHTWFPHQLNTKFPVALLGVF